MAGFLARVFQIATLFQRVKAAKPHLAPVVGALWVADRGVDPAPGRKSRPWGTHPALSTLATLPIFLLLPTC